LVHGADAGGCRVGHLLGPRDFLAYLQSLRSTEAIAGVPEGEDESDEASNVSEKSRALDDRLTLEGLLQQLAEEPASFAEMDRAIRRYGDLIKNSSLPDDERVVLSELMDAWTVIREASLA
jgi:hypothetical protein